VLGVREDAAVLEVLPRVQDEHPVVLKRREPDSKIGPPKERADLLLEGAEALLGDDRLPLDEIVLESREHFLVSHVERPDHHEPGEHEVLGPHDLGQHADVAQVRKQTSPLPRPERRDWPQGPHVEEPAVVLDAEVPLQPRHRIVDREDDRVIQLELETVELPEDHVVGVEELARGVCLTVEVHTPREHSVSIQ